MEYGEVECNVDGREHGIVEQDDIFIPGLPNAIAILCIARVPRSYHHKLKSVCRSWQKLVHGKIFSKVRQELLLVEEWLYLWIGFAWHCFDPVLKKWWKLPPMPRDRRALGDSAFASVDGKLFVIGRTLPNFQSTDRSQIPCRTVSYFDVRTYCWKKAADLNIARAHCMVGIIGNQMYVFGGYIKGLENTTITAEVYDPMTDTWNFVSNLNLPVTMLDSAVIGGKFYAVHSGREAKGIVYDAHTDEWEEMATGLNLGWGNKTTALNGKLYTVGYAYAAGRDANPGEEYRIDHLIQVYNQNKDSWEIVEELWDSDDTGLYVLMQGAELVSLGGKLCILAVQTFFESDSDEDEVDEEVSTIGMVVFEVKESSEKVKCSLSFREEFPLEFTFDTLSEPQAIKRCQVIAL